MNEERSRRAIGALVWFKSSYSAGDGGQCVEVALEWGKSSFSGEEGGECFETAACPHGVHVRDSKDTARPSLTISPTAWTSFVSSAHQ
ncbi:DUF397 domain-containing protein [Streptomyces sp. NBC_00344]|uniref:DUF397 domain-containing protein n=1 Tax=Streptomyces sp. NBC_00344 TaxID=2975720 RepID=UPI002E210AC4